jgi:hypothetical protein
LASSPSLGRTAAQTNKLLYPDAKPATILYLDAKPASRGAVRFGPSRAEGVGASGADAGRGVAQGVALLRPGKQLLLKLLGEAGSGSWKGYGCGRPKGN